MSNKSIEERVVSACKQIMQHQSFISIQEVFKVIGLLQLVHEEDWQKGKIPALETYLQGNPSKIAEAISCLRKWASGNGLTPLEIISYAPTSGAKRRLQYSLDGEPDVELIFRTYYFSPKLTEKELRKLQDRLEAEPDLVVIMTVSSFNCSKCKQEFDKGDFLLMQGEGPLCLNCAGIGDLVFLSRGDPKLTRRAHKYSSKSAVVVRFSKTRGQYERQGILVEPEALEKAESEL